MGSFWAQNGDFGPFGPWRPRNGDFDALGPCFGPQRRPAAPPPPPRWRRRHAPQRRRGARPRILDPANLTPGVGGGRGQRERQKCVCVYVRGRVGSRSLLTTGSGPPLASHPTTLDSLSRLPTPVLAETQQNRSQLGCHQFCKVSARSGIPEKSYRGKCGPVITRFWAQNGAKMR